MFLLLYFRAVHLMCGAMIFTWIMLSQNAHYPFALTRSDFFKTSSSSTTTFITNRKHMVKTGKTKKSSHISQMYTTMLLLD